MIALGLIAHVVGVIAIGAGIVGVLAVWRLRSLLAVRRRSVTPATGQRFRVRVDCGFLSRLGCRLLIKERLPVGHGDLVVVGMDFVEGEEAMPVAAVLDEGSLQRRLYARHFG